MRKITHSSDGFYHLALTDEQIVALHDVAKHMLDCRQVILDPRAEEVINQFVLEINMAYKPETGE
jgi:hypothetical protein